MSRIDLENYVPIDHNIVVFDRLSRTYWSSKYTEVTSESWSGIETTDWCFGEWFLIGELEMFNPLRAGWRVMTIKTEGTPAGGDFCPCWIRMNVQCDE